MTLYILSCELSGTEGNKKCTYTNSYSQTYTQTIEAGTFFRRATTKTQTKQMYEMRNKDFNHFIPELPTK